MSYWKIPQAIQTSHITTCCTEMEQARSTRDVTHPSAILLEVSGPFIFHLPKRTQQNNQKGCQLCKPHGLQQKGQDPMSWHGWFGTLGYFPSQHISTEKLPNPDMHLVSWTHIRHKVGLAHHSSRSCCIPQDLQASKNATYRNQPKLDKHILCSNTPCIGKRLFFHILPLGVWWTPKLLSCFATQHAQPHRVSRTCAMPSSPHVDPKENTLGQSGPYEVYSYKACFLEIFGKQWVTNQKEKLQPGDYQNTYTHLTQPHSHSLHPLLRFAHSRQHRWLSETCSKSFQLKTTAKLVTQRHAISTKSNSFQMKHENILWRQWSPGPTHIV